MATKKSKCSQTGDLNLQEGAIFSLSLNDNRRMIMTGLYFIRFSSQNTSVLTFTVKKYKPEPKSGKDEPKPVNRGSPNTNPIHTLYRCFIIPNK